MHSQPFPPTLSLPRGLWPCQDVPLQQPVPCGGGLPQGRALSAAIPNVTWPQPQPSSVFWDWPQTEYGLRTVQGQHEGGKALP